YKYCAHFLSWKDLSSKVISKGSIITLRSLDCSTSPATTADKPNDEETANRRSASVIVGTNTASPAPQLKVLNNSSFVAKRSSSKKEKICGMGRHLFMR